MTPTDPWKLKNERAISNMDLVKQMETELKKTLLRLSTAGSVDDGKSTLIGRLLYDSKSIFEDQLSSLKKSTKGQATQIDLSLLTDGLRAEREQGITIDVAYRYFSTPKRRYILADTPGHEQYTRNMVTGASNSSVGIVLVDARKGVLVQTKRHSFISSLLGIKRICVAVNKMDLVGYDEKVFNDIRETYLDFSAKLGFVDLKFFPISALNGDNIVLPSEKMPWYRGETLLNYLDNVFVDGDQNLLDFRFPVQMVSRPNQDFRGYAGLISSGIVRKGDEVMVLPSMKTSRVSSVVTYDGEVAEAFAGMSVTITLENEIDISRGDMIIHPKNLPRVGRDFEAMVVWMNPVQLEIKKTYLLQHTTQTTKASFEEISYQVDVNTLHKKPVEKIGLNEISRAALRTHKPIFWDPYDKNRETGSFIVIDPESNHTVAAGMIIDRIPTSQLKEQSHQKNEAQNVRHEAGKVTRAQREAKLAQKGCTIWMTGLSGAGKSTIAKELEESLFKSGRIVYGLDGDNLRMGLNKNLGFSSEDRRENIRRTAEVARLLNDAGVITIVALISPLRADREMARQIIGESSFFEVFIDTSLEECERRDIKGLYKKARDGKIAEFTGVSAPYETPIAPTIRIATEHVSTIKAVESISALLKRNGII
jgi:bifunctional enzyme CysN/CysC